MEKFLLFSTGGGGDDPLNLNGSEFATYKSSNLITMRPSSIRTIDLHFKSEDGGVDVVTLGIKGGHHNKVMRAISTAIATQTNTNPVIAVADMDGYRFIDNSIWKVSIKHQYVDVLKHSATTHIEIPINSSAKIQSISFANTHASTTSALSVWITDITGGDITATGSFVNNGSGYSTTIRSKAIVVDGTNATNDLFLNERVYKNDGTFFGVVTTVGSTTGITFNNGIEAAMTDDDNLHSGTRYKIINSVDVFAETTLVLDSNEINFDKTKYALYMQINAASMDVIVRY